MHAKIALRWASGRRVQWKLRTSGTGVWIVSSKPCSRSWNQQNPADKTQSSSRLTGRGRVLSRAKVDVWGAKGTATSLWRGSRSNTVCQWGEYTEKQHRTLAEKCPGHVQGRVAMRTVPAQPPPQPTATLNIQGNLPDSSQSPHLAPSDFFLIPNIKKHPQRAMHLFQW